MFYSNHQPPDMNLRANPSCTAFFTPKISPRKTRGKLARKLNSKPSQRPSKGRASTNAGRKLPLSGSRSDTNIGSFERGSDNETVKTKPTIEAVRQALIKPRRGTVPMRVSIDYLASICNTFPEMDLAASVGEARAHAKPPAKGNFRPLFPDDVIEAGRDFCKEHEVRLAQLEDVLTLGQNVLIKKHPAGPTLSQDEVKDLPRLVEASLKEYKDLILQIILGNANADTSSSKPPATQHSNVDPEQNKRFSIKPTETIVVNSALHITPTERAISRTIYDSAFDGLTDEPSPVLIWCEDKEGLPLYPISTYPKTAGSLHMELAGQYLLRRAKHNYHQGIIFDSQVATMFAISVKAKGDILSEHKTHMVHSDYFFPDHRPGFVYDVVNLLRGSYDARKMYKNVSHTEVYDEEIDDFEIVYPESP